MATPVKPYKFENAGASLSYTFPLVDYEFEDSHPYGSASVPVGGMNFRFDRYALGVAPVGSRRVRFRATILEASAAAVDTELSDMEAKHRRIGGGKLWRQKASGDLEWCYARSLGITQRYATMDQTTRAVSWEYELLSEWVDDTQATGSETITSDGQTFTINNPGNIPALVAVYRIRANASAGFTNPQITNETTGPDGVEYNFATTRDSASANSEVKLDTGKGTVEYSNDNGSSYADDMANVTTPTDHPLATFILQPGNNTIRANSGGTVNFDVDWAFDPPMA